MFLDSLPRLPQVRVAVANFFDINPQRSQWGPRVLDDYELILQVQGSSRYTDGSKALSVLAGEALLIAPGIRHQYRCALERPGTISCIHFTLNPDPGFREALCLSAADSEVPLLFRRLASEWQRGEQVSQRLCEAMLCEILARLDRCAQGGVRRPRPLAEALAFCEQHFREAIGRSDVARSAGVTPEYLSSLFQKHLKSSPVRWLNELRLREARRLLAQENASVGGAARAAGFEDPLYFSRAFRKRYGVPPSRLRN